MFSVACFANTSSTFPELLAKRISLRKRAFCALVHASRTFSIISSGNSSIPSKPPMISSAEFDFFINSASLRDSRTGTAAMVETEVVFKSLKFNINRYIK